MDQVDVADKRQTSLEMMMGNLSTFMQTTHKDKTEKEERDKEEKEKKDQKEDEKDERIRQWMTNMQKEKKTQVIQCLANFQNQIVPHRLITGGTSGENMSTLTSILSSKKQIVVSLRSFVCISHR